MTRQRHKEIEFVNTAPNTITFEFGPKPATHFLPEWFKKIEPYGEGDNKKNHETIPTIKKCIPVFDALTFGYIITTVCDISVKKVEGQLQLFPSIDYLEIVTSHPNKQAYTHPLATGIPFPKFTNPWAIKTPKGYSCLFVAPLHNPNPYFTALPGIVDTDTYHGNVNFVFKLNDENWEGVIPAGTPIVQVIPFKRNEWESKYLEDDKLRSKWFYSIRAHFFEGYKTKFWSRKSFK